MLIVDVDHLKAVHDSTATSSGTPLWLASHNVCGNLRDRDIAARWGGKEFSVLLSP